VKYVYLDQRVWIELARAANGLSDDEHAKAALAIALAGVDQGLLTFPLVGSPLPRDVEAG
jgi:hypothetical protein